MTGYNGHSLLMVACSGGVDSIALLLGLAALREKYHMELMAAYFDHQLQPTSQVAGEYVQEVCNRLSVRYISEAGDVRMAAKSRSLSVEAAGRALRYDFLAQTASQYGACGVATGHTQDDQAETVLLNILRGSGIRGLAGMRHRRRRAATSIAPAAEVLRPMLQMRHRECERFCRANKTSFVVDETNFTPHFLRNRVRHELLPLMETIRPGATRAVLRLAANAALTIEKGRQDLASLQPYLIHNAAAAISLPVFRLARKHRRYTALRAAIELAFGYGLYRTHIELMDAFAMDKDSGRLDLPHDGMLILHNRRLIIANKSWVTKDSPYPSAVPDTMLQVGQQADLPSGVHISSELASHPHNLTTETPWDVFVDASACTEGFTIRARRSGDRFTPLGMRKSVKLQDFFTNAKVAVWLRDRVPLVETSRGIIWVSGERIADWAKVTQNTKEVVRLHMHKDNRAL